MPFSRPISEAATNYGTQATNILQTSAVNIGNIIMGIARAKAQGIQEGSRAWAQALSQMGITAQNWPMVQKQMEEYARQKEASQYAISRRPANEEFAAAQLKDVQAQASERQAQADERKNQALASSLYAQTGANSVALGARIKELQLEGSGIEPYVMQVHHTIQKQLEEDQNRRATLSKSQREAEAATTAETRRVSGAYLAAVDDPKLDDTTKLALYRNTVNKLIKLGSAPELGDTQDPFGQTAIGLIHRASITKEELDKQTPKPPTGKDVGEWLDLGIRTLAPIKNQQGLDLQLDHLAKIGMPQVIIEQFPTVYSADFAANIKELEKPEKDVPGSTVPFSSAVEAQRIRMGLATKEPPAGTEQERYLTRAAERLGKTTKQLTQEEENNLLGEFKAAEKSGGQPILPDVKTRVAKEDTLWNSLGVWTTGPLSAVGVPVSRVTGWNLANSTTNRQRFDSAKNTLLRALAENPRFPVAEANRIAKEINISPNWLDAPSTLRTRMIEVDRYLADVENRREATKDKAGSMAISQFRQWMGVPSESGAIGGGEKRFTVQTPGGPMEFDSQESADAFRKAHNLQ